MDEHRKESLPAALVSTRIEGGPAYAMFQARRVSGDGAFLEGPLLLEPNEVFTVELALPAGDKLRVRARVVRVLAAGTDEAGMDVQFIDLSDELKRKLSNGRND